MRARRARVLAVRPPFHAPSRTRPDPAPPRPNLGRPEVTPIPPRAPPSRMRASAAFVPNLVLERLVADPTAPARAYDETFPAALLFCDIVGYVRLTGATHRGVARREMRGAAVERLASRRRGLRLCGSDDDHPDSEHPEHLHHREYPVDSGERPGDDGGARASLEVAGLTGETMRNTVNECFSRVVAVVREHGGDVLKFAGDALFAAWPVRHEDADTHAHADTAAALGDRTLRAIQCGLAVQSGAGAFRAQSDASAAASRLRLKVAVAAGTLRGFNVGGVDDRWEYLVAGCPVGQIERCARLAKPGDVLVSSEAMAFEAIQDHVETTPATALDDRVTTEMSSETTGDDDDDDDDDDDRSGVDSFPRSSRKHRSSPPSRVHSSFSLASSLSSLQVSFRSLSFGSSAEHDSRCVPRAPRAAVVHRVLGLTDGFHGVPVRVAVAPVPATDPERLLRRVLDAGVDERAFVASLERYVPEPARRPAADPWLGEIRRCAVVFLGVDGVDYAAADALDRAQTIISAAQTSCASLGGRLRQFLVDEKGTTAVFAFGLPGAAHEDDPWRALEAATRARRNIRRAGLNSRAGVVTGETFCGCVGARSRCEYALYGDAVNVAARLAAHESNEGTLVCETTARACAGRAAFDEGEGLRLKGKRGRTRVFRHISDDEASDVGPTRARKTPARENEKDFFAASREEDARRAIIHALSPPARRAASRAATLGPTFDEELFRAAVDAEDEDDGEDEDEGEGRRRGDERTGSASSAAELVREGILTRRRGDGGESLAFADEALRRVAYGMLPDAARRPAHAAAAAALASRIGVGVDDRDDDDRGDDRTRSGSLARSCSPRALSALARHWMRAGEDARALRCLDLAGTRAAAAGESGDVVVVLTQALDMLREERRRGDGGAREARWLRLLGDARRAMGDVDACVANYRAAIAVAVAEREDEREDDREDAADAAAAGKRFARRRKKSIGCVGARGRAPRKTRSVAREIAALTWRWKTKSTWRATIGGWDSHARLREGALASAALRDVTRAPRDAVAAVAVAERLVDAARARPKGEGAHLKGADLEGGAAHSKGADLVVEALDLLADALDVAASAFASRRAGRFAARLDAVLAGLFRGRARDVRDARKRTTDGRVGNCRT